jgi:hypothetical protein
MKPTTLKTLIYISGFICLVLFLSIRIIPEKTMNSLLLIKTYPEYEDSTKYSELYYINLVSDFKEEMPQAMRKYRFSPEHPRLDEADIIVFGDSHFDQSRQTTFPELLAQKLNVKVHYHRINEPYWGNALAFLETNKFKSPQKKLFIYGTTERYIAERFSSVYEPKIMKKEVKAHSYILNNLLFIKNTDFLYSTILKRSYLTHHISAMIATAKFRVFNYIHNMTPVYHIDKSNGSWSFYFEAVNHFNTAYSDEKIKTIAANIKELEIKMNDLYNMEFLFLPVPENYTINYEITGINENYNDFLPKLYTELDKLGVRYVDIYSNFKASEKAVYYKTDTHWNGNGVNIAIEKVIKGFDNNNNLISAK